MLLLKDGKPVEDSWSSLDDDAPVPADAPIIFSLDRWKLERDLLRGHNGPLGVVLHAWEQPEDIADDLDRFSVIALDFPKFQDGRAYSSARILRERYDYKGEIRAIGNVLPDQFLFMHRCGFDSYAVQDASKAAIWEKVMKQLTVFYQPTGDGRRAAIDLRHRG
jgi:uncharacterized protein (DUF934 family)